MGMHKGPHNPVAFSLSGVDHGTQNTLEVALEQNLTLSGEEAYEAGRRIV